MTSSDLLSLLGFGGALLLVVVAIAGVFAPFCLYSIAGNLRGIRRELERMNATAPAARPQAVAAISPVSEAPVAQTLSHRLTR